MCSVAVVKVRWAVLWLRLFGGIILTEFIMSVVTLPYYAPHFFCIFVVKNVIQKTLFSSLHPCLSQAFCLE